MNRLGSYATISRKEWNWPLVSSQKRPHGTDRPKNS